MPQSGAAPRSNRRFSMLDAMVLLLAIASGLALIKASRVTFDSYWEDYQAEKISLYRFLVPKVPGFCAHIVIPMLVTSALAILILGRVPPRPPWRRWARQPGVIGPLAALLAILIDGVFRAAIGFADARLSDRRLVDAIRGWENLGFVAIVGSWLALRLSGRWRRPLSWPDRLGVWIGIAWVVCAGAEMSSSILWTAMR